MTNKAILFTVALAGIINAQGQANIQAQPDLAIQWQQSFGGTNHDGARVVKQTSDGGYVLGGYSLSGISGNKTNAGFGSYDYWVVKMDAAGNKQWDKTFGGSAEEQFASLQQTSDGGYILGGYSYSPVSGNKTNGGFGDADYWVVKLDANGNKQWDKSYGGDSADFLFSLQQTSDNGYILAGHSYSGISGNKTNASFGTNDYWLVKVDANGNKQWDKSYGGTNYDFLTTVQQTTDGGYMLGGYSKSSPSGNRTNVNLGDYDYWVVKVDGNGAKQWDKAFGGDGPDTLTTLRQTSDGGYILGGYSSSGVSGNKTSPGFGDNDYWVVKLDVNGIKQWDKSFGGSTSDLLNSVQQTSDGGYILGGISLSGVSGNKTSASFGGADYWIVKLASPTFRFNSFSMDTNRVFQAQLTGNPGTSYILQASTNLTSWTSLSTNSSTNGVVNFSDTNAPSFPMRFYRAQQLP